MNHIFKKSYKWMVLAGASLFMAACSSNEATGESTDKEVKVVTTFFPVYDFTRNVVGEEATVEMLIKSGTDTHHFEPTPKDLQKISEADVFIYSSDEMETWVPAVLESLDGTDVEVVAIGANVADVDAHDEHDHDHEGHEHEEHEHEGDDHHHDVDPHVWLDPSLAVHMVEEIRDTMMEVDESSAAKYEEQAASYIALLEELDAEFMTAFEGAENRTFVVQHAAFGYLARRYDLEEVAVSSFISNQEVTPAQIKEVGDFMKAEEISIIYYQDAVNKKLAETIASETGATLERLHSIEGVTDEEQEQGLDYLSLMRENKEALLKTIQ